MVKNHWFIVTDWLDNNFLFSFSFYFVLCQIISILTVSCVCHHFHGRTSFASWRIHCVLDRSRKVSRL